MGPTGLRSILLTLTAAMVLSGCAVPDGTDATCTDDDASCETRDDCMVDGEKVSCDRSNVRSECTVNGEKIPCQGSTEPTGKKEAHDVHDEGDALNGVDRTWTFSVHPNATVTQFTALIHGPGDSGVMVGNAHYQLLYPGGRSAQPCSSSNNMQTAIQVNGAPRTVIDSSTLDVGDWSLRLCIEPSAIEYDVVIKVEY